MPVASNGCRLSKLQGNTVYIESPVAVTADLSGMDGKLMLHQENAKEINISNLANGMYLITIYNTDRSIVKVEKVVKQ